MTSEPLLIYENCLKARYLDERLQQLYYIGISTRPILSGVGAEIGPSIVSTLLRAEDCIIPHYRGFAENISKGASIENIVSEILKRESGLSKGMSDTTSFHDKKHNIFGSTIVLGTKFSIGIGIGFAIKLKKEPGIVTVFFGDGEASRSTFGSALNLASLWKLPILFVCRNNGVSIDAKIENMSSTDTIAKRAQGYDIPAVTIQDYEWEQLYEKSKESIEFVRNNQKPFLLEIKEKRFGSHIIKSRTSAFLGNMIPENEDPLSHFETALKKGGVSEKELALRRKKAADLVEAAINTAMNDKKISSEEFLSIYYE